jgi:16S rRNA (guanine527-N7)-methyltransferase
LYHDWNEKINVISRKDIDACTHILHSLGIAKVIDFVPYVLDVGTGGGFPGIPSDSIPETRF